MAQGPAGQFRYVDLSNERGVRFGGQCPICGARYATPLQPQPAGTPPSEVEAARREVFDLFITAWHELEVDCRGCLRPACPLCWDEEQGLCAECVAQRGLARSPFRGVASSGPLADGRLQVVETGRYSDVARPAWLGDLLARHTGRPQTTGDLSAGPNPRGAGELVQPWMLGMTATGDVARKAYPDAPFIPNDGNMVAAAQTLHVPAPGRGTQGAPMVAPEPKPPQRGPSTAEVHIPNPEGIATSTMVECPRCGTQNYDFVTRC